jgi:hypothetical protein
VVSNRSFSPDRRAGALLAALALILVPHAGSAQSTRIVDACAGSVSCLRAAHTALVLQAAVPLAAVGGNPVPGTASTQGLRLGTLPRLSLDLRYGGTRATVPAILHSPGAGSSSHFIGAFMVDGAVGITPGVSPVRTVGGVGSLDGVASAGFVLPGRNYTGPAPFSWGAGVRLGVLRESITMPGLSLTGMWRGTGRASYGDPTGFDTDGYTLTSASGPSLRATAGKRLLGAGLLAGAGYDRWSGELAWREPGSTDRRVARNTTTRRNVFANVSWTALVLHFVLEAGWQSGPDRLPGLDEAAAGYDPERGSLFGGAAIRLSI